MADDMQGPTTEETPTQHLIRERHERGLQAADNQHSEAREANKEITASSERGASQDQAATPDKTGLTPAQEKHLEIDGEPRMGHAPLPRMNNVITGRHIGREESPTSVLKADGSRSPHDGDSGGSRQSEGHRQETEARQRVLEAAAAERERANLGGGRVVTPTEEQRESGATAAASDK